LRGLLRGIETGARVMLVTHQVNITALTGVFPRSGEVVAFRMDEAGRVVVAARGVLAPA
jgi:hypothetical protein